MVKDSDFLPNSDINEDAEEGVSSDESYYSFESDTEYPERKIRFGSSNSIPKEVRKGVGILGKFERLPKTDICYIYLSEITVYSCLLYIGLMYDILHHQQKKKIRIIYI